jgi:hypothetical protein
MSSTLKTVKGTILPLLKLKGKDYLQVAHRIQWFNEEAERFHIDTDFISVTEERAVARAKVTVFDKEGREVRHATATKQESKKDFPDFIEKSETGAIGRALALMGYGTQFALSDLDEGSRLADSPVVNPKEEVKAPATAAKSELKESLAAASEPAPAAKISTFRKKKPEAQAAATESEEWT